MNKRVHIFANESESTKQTEIQLKKKLDKIGFEIVPNYCDDIDLLVCIGGDGTFLEAMHRYNFPSVPIIGINTGHLGFFQEIAPNMLDDFIFNYTHDNYTLQKLGTVVVKVKRGDEFFEHHGINEVLIKAPLAYSVHLNISIGGSFIERFSGDGVLIATPAGSTAHNYSLGGSIVDPRLEVLQVTPIAPMNTTAYRSFTSSILLPSDLSLQVTPDMTDSRKTICLVYDGFNVEYDDIDEIEIGFSDVSVNLMRFDNYDFWRKVKSKFL
ncbi:MAG: NAD(+)/NADH kinase [Eubacteriaceae bacterium]|nr:NAD(+)/NADH kinase [Eubacteriaceae bacterium]